MTIKQCIKEKGWQLDCDTKHCYRSMDVNVDFHNEGVADETQFLINAYNVDELVQLFTEFCKENDIPKNTVTSITIVQFYEEKA